MKIVQSFWSCSHTDLFRFTAGWAGAEYNLMSWALSCLLLKEYYPNVTLYCDKVSANILIDKLKLPYSNVVCRLDNLNRYHPQLWALPKLYTYAQQDCPFLHIDGDVFIWKKFNEDLLAGKLIAQNEEAATGYYESMLANLESELTYFPTEIEFERNGKQPIHAFNAGIIGGTDTSFFKSYAKKAFQFVDNNEKNFSRIQVSNFNIFFEQYLFYCLAKQKEIKVNVLFKEIISDNKYRDLGSFIEVPHNKKYLHLIGDYKRNKGVCEQLAFRLRQDYPEYYYSIIALFNDTKIPLVRDYFWWQNDNSETTLLNNHHHLKDSFKHGTSEYKTDEVKNGIEPSVIDKREVLKSVLELAKNSQQQSVLLQQADSYANDLDQFENSLASINKDKFINLSREYLYARDISSANHAEYVFGITEAVYDKILLADPLNEVIETKYNWIVIDNAPLEFIAIELMKQHNMEESFLTLVVPECDQYGYSLADIDNLDLLLLETLNESKSIRQLFTQIKFAFDEEDLVNSTAEFEKLIFGRIKKGLINKSIRAIIT